LPPGYWDRASGGGSPPLASAARFTGVEAFAEGALEGRRQRPVVGAVAGGDGEAADQLGVDAFGLAGTALGGGEREGELAVGGAAGLGPGLAVELRRRSYQRRAYRGELTAGLVLREALADRRLPP